MQDHTAAALLTGAARAGNEACLALLSTDRFVQEIDRYVSPVLPLDQHTFDSLGSNEDNSICLTLELIVI